MSIQKIGNYFVVLVLMFFIFVPVRADQISSFIASKQIPIPTFNDIHERFAAIIINESGFKSFADQDGILRALLWNGGGRKSSRNKKGQGYGLDYQKLMKRMAAHSTRIFPSDSKFLNITSEQRILLFKRQTIQNRWTSTLKLDCSEPSGWPETYPSWKHHYGKRCKLVIRTTRAFLRGRIKSYCTGQPTTWGSPADVNRPGGPRDKGWKEIFCNRSSSEYCYELTKKELLNSATCARNQFFNWLEIKKEKTNGS